MTKRKHKPLTAQGIARMKPDPGARRFAALVPWISEAQVRAEAMAKASPATTMPVTVPPWLVTRNSWVSVISQASTTNIARLRGLPLSERKRDLHRLCVKSRVPFMREVQTFPNGTVSGF
jgi:hypothetical protein